MDNIHLDAIAIRRDGGFLVSASSLTYRLWTGTLWYYDKPATAHNPNDCTVGLKLNPSHGGVTDLKWIGDSDKFVASADSGAVMLWQADGEEQTLTCIAEPTEHNDLALSVDVNADHSRAVSTGQDARVKVWDIEDFVSIKTFQGHHKCVWCVACHPAEPSVFMTASQDSRVLLWDTRNPKPASVIDTSFLPNRVTSIAWSSSGHQLAFGSELGHVVLYDLISRSPLSSVAPVHSRHINRIAFSPHASGTDPQLVTASDDCTASVLKYSSNHLAKIYRETRHQDFVRDAVWDYHSPTVYTCAWDGQVLATKVAEDSMAPWAAMNGVDQ